MSMAAPEEASGSCSSVAERPASKTKSPWSKDEDAVLREQVRLHGAQNWESISAALPERNAKSCRLRWHQHLAPGVAAGKPFTAQEDALIVAYQRDFRNKWATIASFVPGRTDTDIKNRWNSYLSKQQAPAPAPAPAPRRLSETLLLFPLAPGDVKSGRGGPLLQRQPTDEADEDDRRGACLNLFPLVPGDLK